MTVLISLRMVCWCLCLLVGFAVCALLCIYRNRKSIIESTENTGSQLLTNNSFHNQYLTWVQTHIVPSQNPFYKASLADWLPIKMVGSIWLFNSNCLQYYLYPIPLMVNSSKRRRLPPHSFHLSGPHSKFLKGAVEVSFNPIPKKIANKARSIVPTFNRDGRHYTCAFLIPALEVDSDQHLRKEHERRVAQAQLEIEDIMYPKPRSRHMYCGVCKEYYEQYKEHVQSEQHLACLKHSKYQKLIREAAEEMAARWGWRRCEDQKTVESVSEDQIFKCLSLENLTEGSVASEQRKMSKVGDQ